MNARKDDQGKPEMCLIPPHSLSILLGVPPSPPRGGPYSAVLAISEWYWGFNDEAGVDSVGNLRDVLEFLNDAGVGVEDVARALEYGKRKYGSFNWMRGMAYSRLVSAALRHLAAHMYGEEKDEESGIGHLPHAACCVIFLIEFVLNGLGVDDRPYFIMDQETPKP